MNYQTEMIPTDVQLLESLLYNAEKEITKIKLKLQFDSQASYEKFKNRLAPLGDQAEAAISSSDQELSDGEGDKSNQNSGRENSKATEEYIIVEKLSRLELSIILKENYKEEIKKIQKSNNVRILIVPEKLKFFGRSLEDIEQAKSQLHDIKTQINISSLEKYGKEVYESDFCRELLDPKNNNEYSIHLGKIAEKYYYWWDQSKSDKDRVEEVLEQIFTSKVHIFLPLLENYENKKRRFSAKYIDAIIKTNAKLYLKHLQNQINDDKNFNHRVELNKAKTEVIIHVRISDQAEMIKYEITKFYNYLIQFFIHYKTQGNDEIQNMNEIEKILDEKGFMWEKYQDIIILCFDIKGKNKTNESMVNTTIIEGRHKEFLDNLRPIFELNKNCYIEYLQDEDPNEVETEEKQTPLQKKITCDYKKYDGVQVVTPKIGRTEIFLQIIDQFILKPQLARLEGHKNDKSIDSKLECNINANSKINDTTSIAQNSMTAQMDNNQNNMQGQNKQEGQNRTFSKPVLTELKESLAVKNYDFYLADELGNNKYDEYAQEISKKSTKISQELENKLQKATRRRYKVYNVIIPLNMKVDLSDKKDIVTVFVKDSDKKEMSKESMNVLLMIDSKSLENNGWLLNVSKSSIKEKEYYKFEVAKGSYEIIKYLKYISD